MISFSFIGEASKTTLPLFNTLYTHVQALSEKITAVALKNFPLISWLGRAIKNLAHQTIKRLFPPNYRQVLEAIRPKGREACEQVKTLLNRDEAIALSDVPDLLEKLRDTQDLEERSSLSLAIAFLVYQELAQTNGSWYGNTPLYKLSIQECQKHREALADTLFFELKAVAKGADSTSLTRYIAESGHLVVPQTLVQRQCIEYAERYFYNFAEVTEEDIDDADCAFQFSKEITKTKDALKSLRQGAIQEIIEENKEAYLQWAKAYLKQEEIDSSHLPLLQQAYESLSLNEEEKTQCAWIIGFLKYKKALQMENQWRSFRRSSTSFESSYYRHCIQTRSVLETSLCLLLTPPQKSQEKDIIKASLIPETFTRNEQCLAYAMRYYNESLSAITDEDRIDIELFYRRFKRSEAEALG